MIKFLFYDQQNQRLRLQFDGGEVYDYYLVEPFTGRAAEVELVGEHSTFFRKSIRGVYPSRRIA